MVSTSFEKKENGKGKNSTEKHRMNLLQVLKIIANRNAIFNVH